MPEPTTASSTTLAAPTPVNPVAGRPIESNSPTFSWTAIPNAEAYRLQIAPEADFETLHFDAPVDNHTELTVYDALPADGSTCYWRVRAQGDGAEGPWSGVAHFVADPNVAESAAEAADEADRPDVSVPTPVAPTDGAPVDGQSAVFEWEPAPAASGYQIQVAPSEDFASCTANLTLDRTTSLTLYGMLPENGSTFYWRLRTLLPGQRSSEWSDPAELTAATDEDVRSHQAEREQKALQIQEQEETEDRLRAAERAEAESPVLTARTSGRFSAFMAYLMVLSFLATLFLIARVV